MQARKASINSAAGEAEIRTISALTGVRAPAGGVVGSLLSGKTKVVGRKGLIFPEANNSATEP